MKISLKDAISIRKFLDSFILESYDLDKKLTHKNLMEYLLENGKKLPSRPRIQDIEKDDIINGNVIFVRDENGKLLAYENPNKFKPEILLQELQSDENIRRSHVQRRKYLSENGLIEANDGTIIKEEDTHEEEYILEHNNRNKVLANRRRLC